MNPARWLCLSIVAGMMFAGVASAAPADDNQKQRNLLIKTMNDGNFNDAYEGFRKLALDPNENPHMAGDDLQHATSCLQRLNRLGEVDAFREAVIEVHKDNWQLLRVAAENYMNLPHHGFIVAGEFQRGNKRGGRGGQMVNAHERDRIRALQLMTQALPLAKQDDNHAIVGDYLLSFARITAAGARPGGCSTRATWTCCPTTTPATDTIAGPAGPRSTTRATPSITTRPRRSRTPRPTANAGDGAWSRR